MPKVPRLVMINTTDTAGGAARISQALSQSLRSEGWQVDMLVDQQFSADSHVHLLNSSSSSRLLPRVAGKNLRSFFLDYRSRIFSNDQIWGVGEELLENPLIKQADIIHCHNLHGNYFKLKTLINLSRRKPIVWTLHDMWPLTARCAHSLDCRKFSPGCRRCPYLNTYQPIFWDNTPSLWSSKQRIYSQSRLNVVSPSPWMTANIKKSLLSGQPLTEILNGVDDSVFTPQNQRQVRRRLNLPLDKKIIAFIAQGGPHNPFKGWQYFTQLVSAYKDNSDVIFLVIGSSSAVPSAAIISLPYQTDPHTLAAYYAASDLLVFPSVAESFGLVVVEAMFTGTPVVAFPVGIVPQVISHHSTGYIAKQNNTQSLLDGVNYCLAHQSTLSANLKRSRHHLQETYSQKSMTASYLDLYRSLVPNLKQ